MRLETPSVIGSAGDARTYAGRQRRTGPSLSVIVVLHNDAERVEATLARLREVLGGLRKQLTVELILIDDGSSDQTAALAERQLEQCHRYGCRLRRLPRNQGFGAALRVGFRMASGSIICTLDGACTYPPEEIGNLIKILNLTGADIVTGSPYHPLIRVRRPVPRRLLSTLACRIYRLLAPAKLYSYTCFFRAYRRDWVRHRLQFSDSYLGITENLIDLAYDGATIIEYPIMLSKRDYGKNVRQTLGVISEHLLLICRILGRKFHFISRVGHSVDVETTLTDPALASSHAPSPPMGDRTLSHWALIDRHAGRS